VRKTDAARANINARAAISSARTQATALRAIDTHLLSPGHPVELGTFEALYRVAFSRGFTAGVDDANGED